MDLEKERESGRVYICGWVCQSKELKRDEKRRHCVTHRSPPAAGRLQPAYCTLLVLSTLPWVFVRNKRTSEYETLSRRSHEKMGNVCRGDAVKKKAGSSFRKCGVVVLFTEHGNMTHLSFLTEQNGFSSHILMVGAYIRLLACASCFVGCEAQRRFSICCSPVRG